MGLSLFYQMFLSTWVAVLVGAMNTMRGAKSAVLRTFMVCVQDIKESYALKGPERAVQANCL